MSAELTDSLHAFCSRHGIRAPLVREPIGAGRNSRVTRLGNQDGQWILKEYGPPAAGAEGGHDRLGAEFAFLQYLEHGSIADVARPIGVDRNLRSALYSWLPGARPTRITADYITQAAQFIVSVNRERLSPQARALAGAADACQSSHDHLALIRMRLTQLTTLRPRSILEEQARELVVGRYVPVWHVLEKKLIDGIATEKTIVDQKTTQILSPSDFGFHNALAHQGRLSFVDFEYAGWDDPAKLICDFICQPELPITMAQGMQFIEQLTDALPHIGDLRSRVERLLPAHWLKWCCILLNEFRPEYHRRRLHAGVASEGLLTAQLDKANRYFDEHIGAFMPSAIQKA
jgi:Phosphotransferase enzyme family